MPKKKSPASNATKAGSQGVEGADETNALKQSTRLAATQQEILERQAQLAQVLTGTPALIICRNKHWRNISSYSGPWLQLPNEVLATLANSNYFSPRPRPVDPAVFFDLVKVRRLIDDATTLAVRAANGTTSAALHTSLNANNGLFNGAEIEILGIGSARGSGNTRLSRERKHRMLQHAAQKLSHAYHLDEIASSVAMMQSASALEDVAQLVLQRDERNTAALYVHHFHEKIPSIDMIEHTSLDSLTELIRLNPTDASLLRTRAATRMLKEDFEGVVRDCTEGLAMYKLYHAPRQNQQDLLLSRDTAKLGRERRAGARVEEQDQPSSMEPQFLYQRASAYLALACENIGRALYGLRILSPPPQDGNGAAAAAAPPAEEELDEFRAEGRRLVRTHAKRALRDYLGFLSFLDYTPGLSEEYTDAFLERLRVGGFGRGTAADKLLQMESSTPPGLAEALMKHDEQKARQNTTALPNIPKLTVYRMNELFAATAPPGVSIYPSEQDIQIGPDGPTFSLAALSEAVTYHPLLTDVLHSLLLCHCLIQTSAKELQRHAYMAARIVRASDGYPVFLASRSPARADWIEVLRRTKNWIGLVPSWDALCTPVSLPAQKPARTEMPEERNMRIKPNALVEALADQKAVGGESFTATFKAREWELKAAREEEDAARIEYNRAKLCHDVGPDPNGAADRDGLSQQPKRGAQESTKRYSVTTERAEVLVRWILEAPPLSSADAAGRPKKKTGTKGRVRKKASTPSSLSETAETGLEQSVGNLNLVE